MASIQNIEFSEAAADQFEYWKKKDPKISQKIESLVSDILKTPFSGKGKPEALKHQLKGYWSRRITREHRLIYKITDDTLIVISCKYHY